MTEGLPEHVARNRARWDLCAPEYEEPGRRNWSSDEPSWWDLGRSRIPDSRASEFGLEFPLLHGNAEEVPLPDQGFDLAISEYGASIWCDPDRWIPEAARLLRPGGRLIFLVNGVLLMLCSPDEGEVPAGDRLLRLYFGMHRFDWPDDDSVEFHLPHGEMVALLRRSGRRGDRRVSPGARRRPRLRPR
jgi:SAM-dependent methyltransferase